MTNNEFPTFSVAMCVYGKDNPEWFAVALNSVIEQTVKPSEIVLVVDGPIPDALQTVIDEFFSVCEASDVRLKVVYLETNQGHGVARRRSVDESSNELVALMDADDVSLPERFESQLRVFASGEFDIVGGDIAEFIDRRKNVVAHRNVPETDREIKELLKTRCPLNQVTVMFKKSAVQKAGGYLDWHCDEDYYLWIRMFLNGARFANTGTVLVDVRVGADMYRRRGGKKYFESEFALQKFMLKNGVIGFPTFVSNSAKRWIVQRLLPNAVRGWVFQKFARSKAR